MQQSPRGSPSRPRNELGDRFASVQLVVFDFDGVFTDNTVYVSQEGVEMVRCWRSDGLGLKRLQSAGVHTLVVSTETNPVVTVRAKKLGVPCKQGVADKRRAILDTCRELQLDASSVVYVGNDINDIPAFEAVGIPVAVSDAYPEVLSYVVYQTAKPGGKGAVREVCDLVFNARAGDVAAHGAHGR
jgi:YrbI family 3-deoxy-D-manno-octulosonate 8-phosphate phosphatase